MESRTLTQLNRRFEEVLSSFRPGVARNDDAIVELAELSLALEVAPRSQSEQKPVVVARMTVIREVGNRTIIEVCDDATFSSFYKIYTQNGNRRSTKKHVRTANRNEGIQPYYRAHLVQPGLKGLAEHWQKMPGVVSVKVRIIKGKAYRRLITASPDQLGLTRTSVRPLSPHGRRCHVSKSLFATR